MLNLKIYNFILILFTSAHLLESVPTVNVAKVDSNLFQTLKNQKTCNIIISMKKSGTSQTLERIKTTKFSSRQERLQVLTHNLKMEATTSQQEVLSFLSQSSPNNRMKSVWITNQIIVWDADLALVNELVVRMPQIDGIHEERIFPLNFDPSDLLTVHHVTEVDGGNMRNGAKEDFPYPWGIEMIDAPSVWADNNFGQGVVIATLGSGVRGTHEALKDNFLGDFGWFDPTGQSMTPYDDVGQGTHATGLVVGTLRHIGVAPGAKWSACMGCQGFSCSESSLLACGQFFVCPSDPEGQNFDCSKAPHLVSNGWGGGVSGQTWFDPILNAWHAAGIVPLFSIGKSGPSCGSIGSPGDSSMVISVGSTSQNNSVSDFSGAGGAGSAGSRVKPDVVAPGEQIFSAYHTSDQTYASMSGSSLSSNYVAGVVALVLSKRDDLSYGQVFEALTLGAVPTVPKNLSCGGIPDDQYPNNHAGYGRISARNSVDFVKF